MSFITCHGIVWPSFKKLSPLKEEKKEKINKKETTTTMAFFKLKILGFKIESEHSEIEAREMIHPEKNAQEEFL